MKINPQISDIVVKEQFIYYYDEKVRALLKYNTIDKKTTSCGIVPGKRMQAYSRFASLLYISGYLFLIPFEETVIVKYDIKKDKYECIDFLALCNSKIESPFFMAAFAYGNNIYLLGVKNLLLLKMDINNNCINCIDIQTEQLKKDRVFDKLDAVFRQQVVQIENMFYVPMCSANILFRFDASKDWFEFIDIGKKEQGYSGICVQGDKMILSPRRSGSVVVWNYIKNDVEKEISIDYVKGTSLPYCGILCCGDIFKLFPMNNIIVDDKDKRYIMHGKYSFCKQMDKKNYYYEIDTGTLYEWIDNQKTIKYELGYNSKIYVESLFENKTIINELTNSMLEEYIGCIVK